MDPNIQIILLGLLTNGLTAFIAQFGRKDSKLLLGEELLKNIKWEETALQPILLKAAHTVAENIEWQGIPTLEIVCLFLTSPEAESIVRQIYATRLTEDEGRQDLASIRKEFLTSFYLYTTSYTSYSQLREDQLADPSNVLFDTLIEACEQVLNVAIDKGKLSAHEAKSAFRHRIILDELIGLRENVNFLTSQKKPNIRDILAFGETYRRQVGNRHKHLIPPTFGEVRRLHINKLYVCPNVTSVPTQKGERPEVLEMTKWLSDTFRAVLLGNPGGGKSTLAYKLCYDLATRYSERLFAGRREITPILVTLRDYGAEKRNHRSSILEFIKMKANADYQLSPPPGTFEYLLSNGRAAVIFDGLDELLDTSYRREISSDVESFCTLYPSVPILVTSREIGYEQAPLDEERFEIFRLHPFDENQVKEYVKKWFDAAIDLPYDQRKQTRDTFFEESHIVPDLRSNPLMLALLCNIYKEENYIPKNRPDVYEKCATMLFERWDKTRGIQVSLPFESHIRPALMYLAYWIYGDKSLQRGVTEERLIEKTTEYLCQRLFEDRDEAENAAKKFIEFCKGRAWVFIDMGTTKAGERLYQFTHQTFLEYFTASHLVRTHPTAATLIKVLRAKIIKREWDVVAQLAFHMLSKHVECAGDKMITALIQDARKTTGTKGWNLLSFIVRCLEYIIPNPKVLQDITLICIQGSLAWGLEQLKDEGYYDKEAEWYSSYDPIEIFRNLLYTAAENRKTVASNIEKLLVERIKNASQAEALLALDIGLNLEAFLEAEEERSVPSEVLKFWESISDQIFNTCSAQIEKLYSVDIRLCYTALWKRKIRIADLIRYHGIEKLFHTGIDTLSFIHDSAWTELAIFLTGSLLEYQDQSENVYVFDDVKDLGRIVLSYPPPWLKSYEESKLDWFQSRTISSEKSEIPLSLNSDILFGAFVLLAVLSEQWKLYEKNMLSRMIEKSRNPLFNFIRWTIIARDKPSVMDKAEAEMGICGFTIEQQNFIRRWIQHEFDLVEKTVLS